MPNTILPRKKIVWTEDNIACLRKMRKEGKSISECAAILNVTYKSAACQLSRMRLVDRHRRYKWTDERINFVRKHFPNIPTDTVGLILGVGESSVRRIARQFGIKKTPEHLFEMHSYVGKCQGKNKQHNKQTNAQTD